MRRGHFAGSCVPSDRGGIPLFDAVGLNCVKDTTADIKAESQPPN